MDCSTQTSQLGIDIKIPNWLPYFDPEEHEAEAGVQTDVMPSSHERGDVDYDQHSTARTSRTDHFTCELGWVDEFDLVDGEATSSMESVARTDTESVNTAAQTFWEQTAVACQIHNAENTVNSAMQTCPELVTTMAQTSQKARVLDYGDAIKAVVAVSACGCPARPAEEARHQLVVIPVGEVGIVKMAYFEKAMVKVDLPDIGTTFLTFMDIEHFCLLFERSSIVGCMNRTKRMDGIRAPSETSRSVTPPS